MNPSMTINNANPTPSVWKTMWREIYRDPLALFGLIVFVGIVITVYIWAWRIDSEAAMRMNLLFRNNEPGPGHLLGFDSMGRDMLTQLILAARNSLTISFAVTIPGAAIGITLGLFMGFYGGHVDNVGMRLIALWSMIPGMMLIIVLRQMFTPGVMGFVLLMLVVSGWLTMTGTVRVMAFGQRSLDYVSASKTMGTPNIVIIFREILPNMFSIITSNFTITLATFVGIETGLAFLGFGLPFHVPSLGVLVANARNPYDMVNRMWLWLPAALLIVVMMLCINFVGQALNRAADAKKRLV